jgi:hypothetical protein
VQKFHGSGALLYLKGGCLGRVLSEACRLLDAQILSLPT